MKFVCCFIFGLLSSALSFFNLSWPHVYSPFGTRRTSPKIFVLKSLEKVFFYFTFVWIKKSIFFLCDLQKIEKKKRKKKGESSYLVTNHRSPYISWPSTQPGSSISSFFSHSEQEKLNNVKNEKKITNINLLLVQMLVLELKT